jgi:hypothetical protein
VGYVEGPTYATCLKCKQNFKRTLRHKYVCLECFKKGREGMAYVAKETCKKPAELRPDQGEFKGSVIKGFVVHELPLSNRVRFRDEHGNTHVVSRKLVRIKRT